MTFAEITTQFCVNDELIDEMNHIVNCGYEKLVIALLDFISAVHYMIHFIYQFIVDSILMGTLEPKKHQLPTSVAS